MAGKGNGIYVFMWFELFKPLCPWDLTFHTCSIMGFDYFLLKDDCRFHGFEYCLLGSEFVGLNFAMDHLEINI